MEDYYDEYGEDVDVENDEGDASRYLDKMLNQYKQKAQNNTDNYDEDELLMSGMSANSNNRGPAGRKRPPAVMWTFTKLSFTI